MANKALVYAIYPNEKQNIQCQKTFGCCRFVYNHMLSLQQDRYKNGEKHLNKKNANNYCNQQFKEDYLFLKEVDKFALTNAIYHLEDGYNRFFKHLSKFPKFKSKHKAKKSYTTNFTNGNIEIGENFIKLPKLGTVKAVIHRKPEAGWKIKSATVTQNRDAAIRYPSYSHLRKSLQMWLLRKQQQLVWITNPMACMFPVTEKPAVCRTISVIQQENWQKHSGN